MKVDLHCHSHYSDGKHSLEFLIQRAHANQVTHLAITDHDCIAACNEFHLSSLDISLINGVEISCTWGNREIHVVGLCFDVEHSELNDLLSRQQHLRRERMQAMDEKLHALGTAGLLAYLEDLPCHAFTRSHAADFLVQRGISRNRQKAFKTYLGKQGRIYSAPLWCSLQQAVATLQKANGIAILAHPGRYALSKSKLESLVEDFRNVGGEGIEVSYSNIEQRVKQYLSGLAIEKKLYCSVGSDFHDSAASWTDIGKYPPLDVAANKNAIWLHPGWHS